MKNIIKISTFILMSLTLLTFTNCSDDSEINENENADLSAKFSSYLSKSKESNTQYRTTSLYDQLNHSLNYENSIFNAITKDEKFDENNSTIYSSVCGYEDFIEFDKEVIEYIISSFTDLNASDFFSKMDSLESFVKKEVSNSLQETYLISTIEEFKWIKYSVNEISRRKNGFDNCFDECMENKIEDALGDANWIEWAYFLTQAAQQVAVWTASCAWNCA